MNIRKAVAEDIEIVTGLMLLLYEGDSYEDLLEENKKLLSAKSEIVFLAYEDSTPVGFAHCSLRYDYVEGTSGGNVGYLEGIYIAPEFRNKGAAKSLLTLCENWAKEKGCKEFASDCELKNTVSYDFHLAAGFKEANRLICFTKEI